MKAGTDYDCLPGLGITPMLNTGGDVFYFPKNDRSGGDHGAAEDGVDDDLQGGAGRVQPEERLAADPADVDLAAANDCMKKGLKILDGPEQRHALAERR